LDVNFCCNCSQFKSLRKCNWCIANFCCNCSQFKAVLL